MLKVPPYKILHLQLEDLGKKLCQLSTEQNGYYLVFWWKNIPLGDLYVEAGQAIEINALNDRILSAIRPAIDFYVSKLELPPVNYSIALFTESNVGFSATLNLIELACVGSPLPEIVDVSVIVCTRNRSRDLKACLESLHSLICIPKEIIVVDNAPSDEQTKILAGHYMRVKYCREPRAGLDIARNTGAYIASCPIIAYVDDDVLLHPLWAYSIRQSFLNPEVGAMTGLIFAAELKTEAQQIFEKHWSFNRGYIDKVYNNAFFKASRTPPVYEIGAGASMAFRKSMLKTTGFFDVRLDVGAAGCNGDSELWYRILLNGYTILYNPRVISYHNHRTELIALKKQLFNYIRGHVVASLIQQKRNKNAGYNKYVYWELPKYYLLLFRCGFPSFSSRYSTIFSEIRGLISGIIYFFKNRHRPSQNF